MKINKILYIVFVILFIGFILCLPTQANNSLNEKSLEEIIKTETSIDVNNVNMGQVLQAYDELTEKYTNKDLANILENHKEELTKYGLDSETVLTGAEILRTTDTEEVKEILKNDIDLNRIKQMLDEGYTIDEIMQNFMNEKTYAEKLAIAGKLVWSNYIVKNIIIAIAVFAVINIIIRWVVFSKAGKHGFAAIIPIYRDITMLKVCGLSPYWVLLLLVPILGWIILAILGIVMRFKLAFAFNRSIGFGFGLLFLGVVFKAIIAFNPNIKYIGFDD